MSPFLQLFAFGLSRYGLQYLLSYGSKGKTSDLSLHTDCLGNADDPLAKTFDQAHKWEKLWQDITTGHFF